MKKRLISVFFLTTYVAILMRIMVFKLVPVIRSGQVTLDFGGVNGGNPPNIVPFATILPYLLGSNGVGIAFLNLVGNIALLAPIGFLVPFVYKFITWKKSLILAVVSGLVIETLQVILQVGIFDIDDVLLNALGVMLGFWVYTVLGKWMREKKYITILLSLIIFSITSAAILYALYPHDTGQMPVMPQNGARVNQSVTVKDKEGDVPETGDLCGGTGGNGQIVKVGDNTFTLAYKEGRIQTIKLAKDVTIHTSKGTISPEELKVGNNVTLVGGPNSDGSFTADDVFVCSPTTAKP